MITKGNALELNTTKGECVIGFDRIYVGAAITRRSLPYFKKLLKPGGILVAPGTQIVMSIDRSRTDMNAFSQGNVG